MTIDEANQMIGAWVKTQHSHGGGAGKLGGQLVGVKGHKLLVKIPGNKEPAERDPGDVQVWKSRTSQNGKAIAAPVPAAAPAPSKAIRVEPPLPIRPTTTTDLLADFEAARAELEQWSELEKSCKEDLEQAKIGYETVNGRVASLRKELNQRINF